MTTPGGDPIVSPPSDAGVPVDGRSALTLVKTGGLIDGDGDGLADVGEKIDYTFVVTNAGTETLTGITVNDAKLAAAGVAITCPAGPLAPGASVTCAATYTVTQADVDAGEVLNSATAQGTTPGGDKPESPESTETIPVDEVVGMSLVKTAVLVDGDGDGLADVGETINYSFAVTNTGKVTLRTITVNDPKLAAAGIAIACPATPLAAGATLTCTAAYVVTQADVDAGTVVNSATASGLPPGSTAISSPPSTAEVPSDDTASLDLVKRGKLRDDDGDRKADPGERIDYTFKVTNTGNVTLHDITVEDRKVDKVTCPPGDLGPGESVTCTASYRTTTADARAGEVRNTAEATGLTGPSSCRPAAKGSRAASCGDLVRSPKSTFVVPAGLDTAPPDRTTPPTLPDTGGPQLWLLGAGTGLVLGGLAVMFAARRRDEEEA